MVKKSLTSQRFKRECKIKYENFYEGTWGCSLLFKARSKSLETKDRTRRWNENEWCCNSCMRMGDQIRENLEHIKIECKAYENERQDLINKINERIISR